MRVTNTPDVLTDDVADMALALILATLRRICVGDRLVRAGAWGTSAIPLATKFTGKRVGILGLGRIGRAIAKRATAPTRRSPTRSSAGSTTCSIASTHA